jgi:23S rRNA (uridine2552-2'-O)-methyltransferase
MNIFTKNNKKNKSKKSWVVNHQNDFYVKKAKENQYRSRASYKLMEINDKYHLIKAHQKILDVGCSPGGWCQVLKQLQCKIWAMDILPMNPIEGVHFSLTDINQTHTWASFYRGLLGDNPFDLIVSDAAWNTSGHQNIDHLRTTSLNVTVINQLKFLLKPKGHWIFKTFNGSETPAIIKYLKMHFERVHTFKPKSSKPESPELYIIAIGFKSNMVEECIL